MMASMWSVMQAEAHPRVYEKRSLATGHFYLRKYKLFQIMEKSGVFYPGRMDCENNEKYPLERQSEGVYVLREYCISLLQSRNKLRDVSRWQE